MNTYTVTLTVRAADATELHALLLHLIEWSNNQTVVTSITKQRE